MNQYPPSYWPPVPPPPPPGPPTFSPEPPPPPSRRALVIALGATAGVAAIIALIVVLVGRSAGPVGSNGESQKSAKDILGDSALAFSKAQSFHLTGTATTSGEKDTFDLRIGVNGTQGTVTANGVSAEVISIDKDVWLRGREFFTTFAGPDVGAAIGDHWVNVKTDDPQYGQYFQVVTLAGLQHAMSQLALEGSLARAGSTRMDGALVIQLRALDGEVDVGLDGQPYPRRLEFKDSDRSADLRMGDYDAPMAAPQRPADVFGVPKPPSI